MSRTRLIPLLCTLFVLACDSPVETAETLPIAGADIGGPASAHGGGHLTVGGTLDVQFAFTAVQRNDDGNAVGKAHHSVVVGGLLVEFYTTVTCLTVDPVNRRAWIGGVITRNNSTNPGWTGAVHEPGDDIWFRVADYGEGSSATQADRSTFVGFEGSAGITTSAQYCATRPWPAGDAGTNPVTSGNIQVRG